MNKNLSDVTVILDRSGSMNSIKADAEGGLNAFIDRQKSGPGQTNFSLVQFDSEYEVVHRCVPAKEVPYCTIEPRGATALLDAIGRTINETGARLAAMPEEMRPGLVAIVILTDGHENHSREYRSGQIKEMIERQEKVYNWQFTYLGANQDAFAVANTLGMKSAATYDAGEVGMAFASAGANVGRMKMAAASGQHVNNSYTQQELKTMKGDY